MSKQAQYGHAIALLSTDSAAGHAALRLLERMWGRSEFQRVQDEYGFGLAWDTDADCFAFVADEMPNTL